MSKWMVSRSALIAVVLIASSCSSYQGIEQFEAYRAAFEKTYAASTAILDQLAINERAIALRRLKITAHRRTRRFDPNLARYYTDSVDPPGTAALRRAIETVKAYNEILHGLATGETATALAAKIAILGNKIADASGEVGALTRIASTAQLKAFAVVLNRSFARIVPLVRVALAARSREEFRRYVIEHHDDVRAILIELRQSTAVIFPVLTAETTRRARISPTAAGGALTSAELEKLNAYRALLADWVILIDASIKAFDQISVAVEAPATISDRIAGLTAITIELETVSQAARKHLAEAAAK